MAGFLHGSRNTILAAYDELKADDLVRGRHGAGIEVTAGSPFPDVTVFVLRRVIRDANYPSKVLILADPDGNPLYLSL
jgi:DNA-binding GntR family transcriptional regulator